VLGEPGRAGIVVIVNVFFLFFFFFFGLFLTGSL
jgi:hypothetical protein